MHRRAICLALTAALTAATAAPVPTGSQLSITMQFKDNGNNLRGKTPGADYAILEDGYAPTIWVEGPYDPGTPCQMSGFERQNIAYVNTIVRFAEAHSRDGTELKENPWQFHDFDTPDYLAAVLTAGKYHYCPDFTDFTPSTESEPCPSPSLAPTDAVRQDPSKGGEWCAATGSVICDAFTTPWVGTSSLGDISRIPDGITSATIYPDSQVTFTWDMRDAAGTLIEEGHYLVYVMMSAERSPREIEGQLEVGGIRIVNLETCWDDSYYDDKGHHRVVNLFQFKDSAFTVSDMNEKKYSGDQYDYLDTPIRFEYTVPATVVPGTGRSAAPSGNAVLTFSMREGTGRFQLVSTLTGNAVSRPGTFTVYASTGRQVYSSSISQSGVATWEGLGTTPGGTYLAEASVGGQTYTQRILLTH